MKALPCFFYKTTVVFVDDNESFLDMMSLSLGSKYPKQVFSNPHEALEFFSRPKNTLNIMTNVLEEYDASTSFGTDFLVHEIKMDMRPIFNLMYDPKRFNEATVVFVDFSMPEMNGLVFCEKLFEKIARKNIKIILLTGEAGNDLAVEAFNAGKIDAYISKKDHDFLSKINDYIGKFQYDYFSEISAPLFEDLITSPSCCLKHENFHSFLAGVLKKNDMEEYYLARNTGSFILLAPNGVAKLLLVMSQDDLSEYIMVAEDHYVSFDSLEAMRKGEKIPFFVNANDYVMAEADEWAKSLYPATCVHGSSDFYYAIISDLPKGYIEHERIFSYRKYLASF